MTEFQQQQRRHLSRIAFDAAFRIRLTDSQILYTGHVIDLSLKGALIQRPSQLNVVVDDMLMLDLLLDDSELQIHMQVRVAHLHPQAIGVVREAMDLTSMSHLCRFLELNLGSDALLERELSEMLQINMH